MTNPLQFLRSISGQLLLLALAAVLPLAGTMAFLLDSTAVLAKQMAFEQVRSKAQAIAEDCQAFLAHPQEVLEYIATRPQIRALDPANCDPLLTEVQRMSSFYSLTMLLDTQGRMVCQSLTSSGAAPSYADREWFQRAIRETGFGVQAPILGRQTGHLVLPLTMPVRDAQGTTMGVLVFAATLRGLTHMVERSVPLPTGSLVTLVSAEGTIIARSPEGEEWLGKPASQIPTLARHLTQREGVDNAVGADGLVRMYAFTTVPGANWLVSVGLPAAAVELQYRAQLKLALGLIGLTALLVLVLSLAMAKAIRQPILALAQTARRTAQGELAVRATERGATELVNVAREFNRMLALQAAAQQALNQRNTQLETANQELEAFAYSVSHDLRAPLRAIDGFSHKLVTHYGAQLDDEGRRLLQVVRDNARRMGELIDNLLAFSRMGRREMVLQPVDMQAMAQSVADELRAGEPPERAIEFSITALPATHGDTAMLRQVWLNLLGNAVKFTRKRALAHIEVGGDVRGDEVVYWVKDDGAGFDMQYADKLFGVFQRLHSQEEFEGTGVGLAIAQRILHRHHGRIWGEGKTDAGATFHFALPQNAATPPQQEKAA